MHASVVVGVDGSASSLGAVDVAAREARLRGCALKVVHAFTWPMMHVPLGPSPLGPPEGGLRNIADRLVADAVQRAHDAEAKVEVTSALVTGEPLTVLEAQSRKATLVVVGTRGAGGFVGLLVGSTAVHLAAHSHSPVLVVKEQPRPVQRIVVGVDGSPAGEAAVEFAFAEAALRHAPLTALHAWTLWNAPLPELRDDGLSYTEPAGKLQDSEERLVAQVLAGRTQRYPGVPMERKVVRSGAREALIEASKDADLVVLGARGRGGFTGLLLGSVSQALLHHAHCSVAVVRGADARQ